MAVKPLQNPLANSIHEKDARGKVQLLTKSAQGLRKGSKTGHRRLWGVEVKNSVIPKRAGKTNRENEVTAPPRFTRRNSVLV